MITTKNEAPAEFMQRYQRIMNGEEKLDTLAKLKEFWLFSIEQGNGSDYPTRAGIAGKMLEAAARTKLTQEIVANKSYHWAFLRLESYAIITIPVNDPEYDEVGNNGWMMLANAIERCK